jgi:hypothetical protein
MSKTAANLTPVHTVGVVFDHIVACHLNLEPRTYA